MSVGQSWYVHFGFEKLAHGAWDASVVADGVGRHGKGGPMYVVLGKFMRVLLKLGPQLVTVTVVVTVDAVLQLVVVVHVRLLYGSISPASCNPKSRCFKARR